MSISDFKRRLTDALNKYLPHTTIHFEERRGTEVRGRVHIDDVTRIEIYYSAVTGKTSYALIQEDDSVRANVGKDLSVIISNWRGRWNA